MRKIALLLGLFILSFSVQSQKEINLEDIWKNGIFRSNNVPGFNFMLDGKHYTKLSANRIEKYDLTTGGMADIILDGNSISEGFVIDGYHFSEDERFIVLQSNTERIYRRSYTAQYVVFDRENQQSIPISDLKRVSYVTLNSQGDKAAFVMDNNLYYQDLTTSKVVAVTKDGEKNKIINGSTDWVYEEELSFVKAFEWSTDGDRLAFIRFDESEVKEFTMTLYQKADYPVYQTFKYPKVGEKNADVSVLIYNIRTASLIPADIGDLTDIYIPRIKWSSENDHVCVYKLNRHQNHLQIFRTNAVSGKSKIMLEEKNKYYIDIHDNLTFVDGGKCFIWSSEIDGNNHLYLYSINGKLKNQITSGDWEVTDFYGYDEKNDEVYFQSTEPGSTRRGVYAIDIKGKNKRTIVDEVGTNSAQFSSTFDYCVWKHSTCNAPPSYNVHDRKGKLVRPLEDNLKLKSKIANYGFSNIELMTIRVSDDVDLNSAIIKPKDFDPNKKYPLLMYLYGGPGDQKVLDGWNSIRYLPWFQMLTQKGYIIAVVDNRGTGGRGEAFKKMTYLQLGHYETIDQINAAKFLGAKSYIDKDRIGIFGWSYGAFMSSLCLFKGNDVFKAALAVAPVTNWKWYDSIYTERFMRTVDENEAGYYDNSPINFAGQLKGKYLLVHGVADDNVHFQNTAELANELIRQNKQFDTYFYPNRNHSIFGDNARLHLFTKMTDFILENI